MRRPIRLPTAESSPKRDERTVVAETETRQRLAGKSRLDRPYEKGGLLVGGLRARWNDRARPGRPRAKGTRRSRRMRRRRGRGSCGTSSRRRAGARDSLRGRRASRAPGAPGCPRPRRRGRRAATAPALYSQRRRPSRRRPSRRCAQRCRASRGTRWRRPRCAHSCGRMRGAASISVKRMSCAGSRWSSP